MKVPNAFSGSTKTKASGGKLMAVLMTITLTATMAFAGKSKVDKDLQNLDPASTVDVIVKYKHGPDDSKAAKIARKGGHETKRLHLVKASAVTVSAARLNDVADDDEVESIVPDRSVNASAYSASVATINAPVAWQQYGVNGTGIGIALIDSGVFSSVTDLTSRIAYNQTWVGNSATDQFGHGTHVAGILAGTGKNSTGSSYSVTFMGIAPGANLVNLRVLDQNGMGKDSDVIAAIQTAIQLKSKYNIRVLNLSLGRPVYGSYKNDPLCQAVEAAWKAGIVVVVAAGNYGRNNYAGNQGYGTITAPGNDPYVITVGAMKDNGTPGRNDDTIASYSSKGPTLFDQIAKPDLVAPGNQIISTRANNSTLVAYPTTTVRTQAYKPGPSNTVSSAYLMLNGTSMAAPVVSGAAALLLQQNPKLTPDQVKVRLMETASKTFPAYSTAVDPATGAVYTSQYDIFTIGAGYLDIAAALGNYDLTNGPAVSPTAVYDQASGNTLLSIDTNSAFANPVNSGSAVLWGTSVLWGTNVVNSYSVLWGSSVIWGNSSSTAFSVLWGTTSTSGSSVLWGSSTLNAMSVLTQGEN
jgi:serine protease AprX